MREKGSDGRARREITNSSLLTLRHRNALEPASVEIRREEPDKKNK